MQLAKSELIKLLRSGKTGTHAIGDRWRAEDVAEMWETQVGHRVRRRYRMTFWPGQVTLSVKTRPARRPTGLGDLIFGACAGLAAVVALSYALLPAPAHIHTEPSPTCWERDRDNHTLSVANTLDQFEIAHEAYRRTGRAPDRLEECSR